MPNTLAHITISRILSKPITNSVDYIWVYIGCVLPDIPWIFQRVIKVVFSDIDTYDLRLYSIAQASLFFCILLSISLAFMSSRPRKVVILLIFGALIHLLLDASQTKWANGVHLLAPVSWDIWSVAWYWPESVFTYFISIAGLVIIALDWNICSQKQQLLTFSKKRASGFIVFMLSYLILPIIFFSDIEASNNHFIQTLRDVEHRIGKSIEFDRSVVNFEQDKAYIISSMGKDKIYLTNLTLNTSKKISFRGVFVDVNTIEVYEFHVHERYLRDAMTTLGLLMILVMTLTIIYGSSEKTMGK